MITGTPTILRASSTTAAGLSGTPDDQYQDGDFGYVSQTKQTYRLDRASTATPDGTTTLATFSHNGRWIAFPGSSATPDVSQFDGLLGAANINYDSANPNPWEFFVGPPITAPAAGRFLLMASLSAHLGPNAAALIFDLGYKVNGGATVFTGSRGRIAGAANGGGSTSMVAETPSVAEGDQVQLVLQARASADGAYTNTPQGDGLTFDTLFLYD